MIRPLAVLDIDGVVADPRHRLHILAGAPDHEQWVQFFAAAAADVLLSQGAHTAAALAVDHDIVWLTGRPERTRDLTARWLREQALPAGELRMQGDDDRRPARAVKLEQLHMLASTRVVDVVIDDDPRVVALLSAAGYPAQLATWLRRNASGEPAPYPPQHSSRP